MTFCLPDRSRLPDACVFPSGFTSLTQWLRMMVWWKVAVDYAQIQVLVW